MSYRSLLYILGTALTATGCCLPWSCHQVGQRSWRCPSGIELTFVMQGPDSRRLVLQQTGPGTAVILLLLTLIIVWFAFSPPRSVRRPNHIAGLSAAALLLISVYQFTVTLTTSLPNGDDFAVVPIWSATVLCLGALLTLVAGAMDLRAGRHQTV